MRRAAISTAFVFASLLAMPARASVPDHYGFGSRASAMAGAVTADVRDFSAGYYNPAGLSEAVGVEVAVGYSYNVQKLTVNGLDNDVDDVHGLVAGLVAPGKLWTIPFAFGIGVHLPDDGISFIKARRQGVPRWELYDARAQLLYLEASLAIRPWPWLELGGGIGYLSATRGQFAIRGKADVLDNFDSELEHEVDADLTAVRYPQAGARLVWEGWGALGATFRGESKLDLQLGADLNGVIDFAGIEVPLSYVLEAKTIASFTPRQVAMGISFQRIDDLHVNFDLTWMQWSRYVSPTAQIQAELDIEPPPAFNIEIPDAPAPTEPVPPVFRDRWVPRIGVEYRGAGLGPERQVHGASRPLLEVPLRIGYSYEKSPVPDQPSVTNFIDADRHTITVGVGAQVNGLVEELPGSLHLDLHAAFSVLPERVFLKDSPADFVGDFAAAGSIFGAGATMRAVF